MVYTNGWFIYPMDSFFMAIYYAKMDGLWWKKKQRMDDLRGNVGKTMTFLPPMTGNGKHTTYKKRWWLGDGLLLFYHVLPTISTHLLYQVYSWCLNMWRTPSIKMV